MTNTFKFLKVIFLLLLMITIGEVVYYLILNLNLINLNKDTSIYRSTTREINNGQEDNSRVMDMVSNFKKMKNNNLLLSSLLTTKFQGYVYTISRKREADQKIKIVFKLPNEEFINFVMSDYDVSKTKVFRLSDGKEDLIKLDDLKPGDNIIIESVTDLTKKIDSSIVEINIRKIE